MGEYAEDAIDSAMEFAYQNDDWGIDVHPPNYKRWRTADGEVMDLEDMTDQHLENCIAFLKRRPQFRQKQADRNQNYINAMEAELRQRRKHTP